MSNAIQCDTCGASIPTSADKLMDWMRVEYGIGRMNTSLEDFCSLDCLERGVKEEVEARRLAEIEALENA